MISAKILKFSEAPDGRRLCTFQLTYPRFIHSEFMTHRCFSRNASSSRAIPILTMIEQVQQLGDDVFEFWGANESGMEANTALAPHLSRLAKIHWMAAKQDAMRAAFNMHEDGSHKQNANRLLEPFSHITVIATATDVGLANFFKLRASRHAQPEFQVLAYRMLATYLANKPVPIQWGEWHIPMDDEINTEDLPTRLKIATGRLTRVSYLKQDGRRASTEDIGLHDRCVANGHWSGFEHCAQAMKNPLDAHQAGNFGPHWLQYRKMFMDEAFSDSRPETLIGILAQKPDWVTL